MIDSLKDYIQSQKLCSQNDRLLLTVSGGIDSMVMLHLVNQTGLSFGVAHCNFQLRGQESEEDALFVKTSVESLGIPFYMARFETKSYAEDNKISIQMAARELRYNWFESIKNANGYHFIATAHNANDSIETFFINLSRGCGIDGLAGIKPKSGNIIRPLLFASREQITAYANEKGVQFREDSSNNTDKYLRNYIRHHVMPVLDEASPNFRNGIHTTIQNLINSQGVYDHLLAKLKNDIISYQDNNIYIDISKLKENPNTSTILWEILNPFQFNRDSCIEIANSLDAQPGKLFFSASHRLIKDRTHLIVTTIPNAENSVFYIDETEAFEDTPFKIEMEVLNCYSPLSFENNENIAMLDYNLLEWPLALRKWRQGDYFAPLGMENLKKVSDFLIDKKLSIPEKENIWVLESGNHIVWIVGKRVDHRFRITDKTKRVLRVKVGI